MVRLGTIPLRRRGYAPAKRKRLQVNKASQVFFFFKPTSGTTKKPNPLAMLITQHHSKPKRTVPQNRNNRYRKMGTKCTIPWHTLWPITWYIKENKFQTKTLSKRKQGECYGAHYAHIMSHSMVH